MTDIKMATKRFEILDYVLVGICVIKKDFTVLFWNNWLEDCTGISRSKIVGKKLGEYFPHLLESSYKTRIESVFWSAAPTIFSSQFHKHIFPAYHTNGKFKVQHVTITAVPAFKEQGYYALFTVEDVTELVERMQDYRKLRDQALEDLIERKKVEEAFMRSEIKLKSQFKAIPIPTYIWKKIENDFILESYNDAANKITEGRIAQYMGVKCSEIYQNEPKIKKDIARCFQKQVPIARELRVNVKTIGKAAILALKYAYAPPDQVIMHAEDITARKNAEKEREKLIKELQDKSAEVKTLSGLLPICSNCKKIRDDRGYWNQLEDYIYAHSGAEFSHSICPECFNKLYPSLSNKKNKLIYE